MIDTTRDVQSGFSRQDPGQIDRVDYSNTASLPPIRQVACFLIWGYDLGIHLFLEIYLLVGLHIGDVMLTLRWSRNITMGTDTCKVLNALML